MGILAVLFDAGDILYNKPRRKAAIEKFLKDQNESDETHKVFNIEFIFKDKEKDDTINQKIKSKYPYLSDKQCENLVKLIKVLFCQNNYLISSYLYFL